MFSRSNIRHKPFSSPIEPGRLIHYRVKVIADFVSYLSLIGLGFGIPRCVSLSNTFRPVD